MLRVWTHCQPVPESNQNPLPIEDIEEEDDGEVIVHQQDDSDASVEEYEFNRCMNYGSDGPTS